MPKKTANKDEEWEDYENIEADANELEGDDVDADDQGEDDEEEEEDTTINNSDVMVRYKKAASWCNETLQVLIKATKPGVKVFELCRLGDETIQAKLKTMFKGAEKGIGFPTCISVNNCVCHNSPGEGDESVPQEIKQHDIVHYDLGIQVEGYCAQVAHTIQVTENNKLASEVLESEPANDTTATTTTSTDGSEGNAYNIKAARVITAAHHILSTAIRKMRPGATIYDVTEVIEKAAKHFEVTPVDGVLSHMLKRYIIDSYRCIPQRKIGEQMVHNYEFEKAQVWTLDIVMSSGKGKLRERDARPYIYKPELENNYTLKMESARELQKEIDAKFSSFPFAVRNLETKKARLGLAEMIKHDAVIPYPVLYERDGEVVAQFKATILIGNKKIEQVTGLKPQKGPVLEPYTDTLLTETIKLPFSLEEKKKKKAAAAEGAEA